VTLGKKSQSRKSTKGGGGFILSKKKKTKKATMFMYSVWRKRSKRWSGPCFLTHDHNSYRGFPLYY